MNTPIPRTPSTSLPAASTRPEHFRRLIIRGSVTAWHGSGSETACRRFSNGGTTRPSENAVSTISLTRSEGLGMDPLERNKRNVTAFYDLAFNQSRPAEAIEKYPRPRPTTTRCSEPRRLALRNRPEIERARSRLHRSLRRPGVAEPVAVRDDARSGRELAQQLRQQAPVERLEEEQRHHRGFADVGLEQVAAHEAHAVLDPGAARVVDRHAQRDRVDLGDVD